MTQSLYGLPVPTFWTSFHWPSPPLESNRQHHHQRQMDCHQHQQQQPYPPPQEQEVVAVAIPLDMEECYPQKPQARQPPHAQPVVASVDQYVCAPETPQQQQTSSTTNHRKPPCWLAAFAAMFLYHVLSALHCLVSMVGCFTTVCLSIILLPFCLLGLVFFRLHVLLVDLLLNSEVRLHNWTVTMLHREDLVLEIPHVNGQMLPTQADGGKKHVRRFCNLKSLAKTVYFGILKWALLYIHVFGAVFSPVTALVSLFIGCSGMCPAAHLLLKLTRYVAQKYV